MCHDTMGADVADVTASLALCECAAKIALGSGFAGPLPDLPDLPVGFPSLCRGKSFVLLPTACCGCQGTYRGLHGQEKGLQEQFGLF
jgi:hypothetical protein